MIHTPPPAPVPVSNVVESSEGKRLRSFTVSAASQLQFVLQNAQGLPFDLEGETGVFPVEVQEAVSGGLSCQLPVSVQDAPNGVLRIQVPSSLSPGVYRGTVTLVHDGVPIIRNTFRLYVSGNAVSGPPSMEELRLFLRDSVPEESYLLDGLAYGDAEILASMERAVRYFNEVPPNLGREVDTSNFPWRNALIEGTLGQLYLIAAESYRRNSLQYQAGGVSVADQDKERNYQAAASVHWQNYREFTAAKKAELNMAMGWGFIPSPYSFL